MWELQQVLPVSHLLCAASNLNIFSIGIDVSDGFLVREVGSPSPASGLLPIDVDKAVWLVEPRRTTSVQKFSGTLAHPNWEDHLGLTLIAFTHCIYDTSDKELVLADIQGEVNFQLVKLPSCAMWLTVLCRISNVY